MTTTSYSDLERFAAEVAILRRYADAMRRARYDYGAGQRRRELRRLDRELHDRAYRAGVDGDVVVAELAPQLLLETFERIAIPRMRRMSSGRRAGWFSVVYELARAGAELLPDRQRLELENGHEVDIDTAVEVWADRQHVR